MPHRFRVALLSLLLVTFSAASLSAQNQPGPKARKAADAHFKEGIKLAGSGEFESALRAFEEAYELAPHPLVLFNIAGAHRALKHYREALDAYSRFMLEGDGVVRSDLLARAKSDLDELLALIGRVEIDSEPRGARIVVNGADVGTTPVAERLVLPPGTHLVRASLSGYRDVERSVRVSPGDELKVSIALEPVASAVAAPIAVAKTELAPRVDAKRWSVAASVGTNTLEIANTGAPTLGLGYAVNSRLSLGVEVVLVAYSAIPQLRYRLAGDAFSVHAIAALPLNQSTGAEPAFFVAGAGGLGARYQVSDRLGLRVEGLLSYAGSERGLTIPAFAGGEVFF